MKGDDTEDQEYGSEDSAQESYNEKAITNLGLPRSRRGSQTSKSRTRGSRLL